jgi:hypothetical protein
MPKGSNRGDEYGQRRRWLKRYPDRVRARDKRRRARRRERARTELRRSYIVEQLVKDTHISRADLPEVLIEAKRAELKLGRVLRERSYQTEDVERSA